VHTSNGVIPIDKYSDATEVPVFDPTRLNTLLQLEDDDDHSTIKAIVEQFLLDVTALLDSIEHAIASKNFPLVASAAHTIKGNAATFGLYQVAQIAKHLEALAKGSGNEDPAALCKSLREAFATGKSVLSTALAAQ
jgi:HPt (histidine-containing phosphotransfer) domain-containing protein